jgi:hypothetical protein
LAKVVQNLGTCSLLKWAKENSNRFFENLPPKAAKKREAVEEVDE